VADAEAIVRKARTAGGLVAFHAGEKNPDDVDEALAFEPDLLVHCTHATDAQLRQIVDLDIPHRRLPEIKLDAGRRSITGHPPIARILELGGRFFLGTDNVMFVQPDMLQEMAFYCDSLPRATRRESCVPRSRARSWREEADSLS